MQRCEQLAALQINAAEWYERADFLAVLNGGQMATWHTPGEPPGDYSDMFMTFDSGEGSNSSMGTAAIGGLPEDIWAEITRLCNAHGLTYGIVRITPLEAD